MWQKFKNDPVCFGARDNQYGAFIVTKSGLVKAMKFTETDRSNAIPLTHLRSGAAAM